MLSSTACGSASIFMISLYLCLFNWIFVFGEQEKVPRVYIMWVGSEVLGLEEPNTIQIFIIPTSRWSIESMHIFSRRRSHFWNMNTIQTFYLQHHYKRIFMHFTRFRTGLSRLKQIMMQTFCPLRSVTSLGCNDNKMQATHTCFKVNCKEMQYSATVILTITINLLTGT
jgi:hypothetical protein